MAAGLLAAIYRVTDKPWRPPRGDDVQEAIKSLGERFDEFLSEDKEELTSEPKKPQGEISVQWSRDREHREPLDGAAPARPHGVLRVEKRPSGLRGVRSLTRSVLLVRGVADNRELTPEGMFLTGRRSGHGFVVRREKYSTLVVTAAHLFREALPEVTASPQGGYLPAEVVSLDAATDLALLRVSNRVLTRASALTLEPPGSLRAGQPCWVVSAETGLVLVDGTSLGRTVATQRLIAEAWGVERARSGWFLISQAGHPGLSGAPVLSSSGRVAGVLIGGIELPDGPKASIVMGPEHVARLLERLSDRSSR